jgi:hypothetical protein
VEPGAAITLSGRPVDIDAVSTGSTVTVVSQVPRVVAPTPAPVAVPAPGAHPPVDVSGTVAQVDRQNGIVTLQDGRLVRLTEASRVWQPARLDALRPGTQVYIRNAQAAALGPGQTGVDTRMGTVVRVDSSDALIMLDDGSFVKVRPATKVHMAGRTLAITELRPGDEIVIRPHAGVAASPPPAVSGRVENFPSALPRQEGVADAIIEADDIEVMHRPQAP